MLMAESNMEVTTHTNVDFGRQILLGLILKETSSDNMECIGLDYG